MIIGFECLVECASVCVKSLVILRCIFAISASKCQFQNSFLLSAFCQYYLIKNVNTESCTILTNGFYLYQTFFRALHSSESNVSLTKAKEIVFFLLSGALAFYSFNQSHSQLSHTGWMYQKPVCLESSKNISGPNLS